MMFGFGYSPQGDVLYLKIKDSQSSYGDMIDDNIIVFRDENNDEIVGVEIINFSKLYRDGTVKKFFENFPIVDLKALSEIYKEISKGNVHMSPTKTL